MKALSQFLTNAKGIDANKLQAETLKELESFKRLAQAQIHGDAGVKWLTMLTNRIGLMESQAEKEKCMRVKRQISGIEAYIQGWINLAVDSPERFSFFVKTKAQEIGSGDTIADYYYALSVRHDQLVALTRVLNRLFSELNRLVKLSPQQTLEDPIFQGLLSYDLEQQVFLEAQVVYKERINE